MGANGRFWDHFNAGADSPYLATEAQPEKILSGLLNAVVSVR
jgi:hypothetical protein